MKRGGGGKEEKEMHQRTGSEINISGPWYRCIDRKLRIYSSIRGKHTQLFFQVAVLQRQWF